MSDTVQRYTIEYRTTGDAAVQTARLRDAVVGLNLELDTATEQLKEMTGAANGLKNSGANAAKLATAVNQIGLAADRAADDMADLAGSTAKVGGSASEIAKLRTNVQQLQRTTYGASKNAEDAAKNYHNLGASATAAGKGLADVKANLPAVASGLKGSKASADGLGTAIRGVVAGFGGFLGAREIVGSVGSALTEATDKALELAEGAIKLRDNLRELANLDNKAGADDQVVAKNFKFRKDSAMTEGEARKFQEQFAGSLPLSTANGGLTAAIAEPLGRKVASMAARVGLDGGTAGELGGMLGAFGKVDSANEGLGKAQTIVDQLNDGKGNLTPLTKELLKNAGSTVGKGNAFASLEERAAAIGVSSGLGSVGGSSTRINQAIAGLGGFDKEQGDALRAHGIKGEDDFMARIDKIAPIVEAAQAAGKDPKQALAEAGFKNRTERDAIIGFVNNRDALRQRMASVREDAKNPKAKANASGMRSEALNKEFQAKDQAARNRIAEAKRDEARFNMGKEGEDYAIAKKEAEARLIARGEIDRPGSNVVDKVKEGFGILPFLGGKTGRDQRIDEEIKAEAERQGLKTPSHVGAGFAARALANKARSNAPAKAAPRAVAGPADAPRPILPKPEWPPKVAPPKVDAPKTGTAKKAPGKPTVKATASVPGKPGFRSIAASQEGETKQTFHRDDHGPADRHFSGGPHIDAGAGGGGNVESLLTKLVHLTEQGNRERQKTNQGYLPPGTGKYNEPIRT